MQKLIVASNNKGKIAEIKQILTNYEVVSLKECGIDVDVEETGTTFAENAYIKAKAIFDMTGVATLADDSGLMVDALGGEPGVYSARYAGGHDDKANNAKLLANLQGVTDRSAKFVSAIVYIDKDRVVNGYGEVKGTILHSEDGNGGFGYDPLFYCDEIGKSFGIATSEEKNAVSHRYRALCDLVSKL